MAKSNEAAISLAWPQQRNCLAVVSWPGLPAPREFERGSSRPPFQTVLSTYRGVSTRDTESFGRFGTGCEAKRGSWARGVGRSNRTRESPGGVGTRGESSQTL